MILARSNRPIRSVDRRREDVRTGPSPPLPVDSAPRGVCLAANQAMCQREGPGRWEPTRKLWCVLQAGVDPTITLIALPHRAPSHWYTGGTRDQVPVLATAKCIAKS